MENNVVTLETAKKLNAAGFLSRTTFMWSDLRDGQPWLWQGKPVAAVDTGDYRDLGEPGTDWVAAPTAQEIADQLDEVEVRHWRGRYTAWCRSPLSFNPLEAPTMAEALALLWLKLQEVK
jgi:hypothetical protein